MIELPHLDLARCAGHGDCVVVCPTRCLEFVEANPHLVRPRDCIACSLCVLVCPEQALRMVEVEERQLNHG